MKRRNEFRVAFMCIIVCFCVIGCFSLASKAATAGHYATLSGDCYNNPPKVMAAAMATNTSNVIRYINVSVKDGNYDVLGAAGAKVSPTGSTSVSDVDVTTCSVVYAHCTVYNSAATSSGTAETLYYQIK